MIYDTDDQQSLMKQAFRDLDLPLQGGALRTRSVLEAISRAKNNLELVEDLVQGATTHHEREVARIATRYTERLRAAGALDFDDLLVETVRLLETQPEVLARYQARWRYLHVDEYQDTNAAQYRIVRALAAAHHNLCVVGDDDQSIYAWRGADLRNILDFERDEPGATVVKLEQNYRSTELILRAAHAVVANNEGRKEKELWTERAGGRLIARFEAYNEEEEAEWIARQVEGLMGGSTGALTRRADEAEKLRPKEIAVLYRTNAQSRAIEEAFLRYGLRYQLIGGTRFYQRREVKDALAYLRVLRSDTDIVSYERIINLPARGIGDKTLEILRMAAAEPEQTYWSGLERAAAGELLVLGSRARAAVADFAGLVRRLRTRIGMLGLPELLDDVLEASGYRAMLADGTEENEERWRNLLELRSVTTRYDDLAPDDALDRLLEETALVADQDAYEARRRRGDPDHAPCGEGSRVRGGLHLGDGGGRLPAQPGPRRRDPARGGAPPRVRGHHAGQGAALPLARLAARHVGAGQRRAVGAVTLPPGDPRRPHGWAASSAGGGERRGLRPRPCLRRPAQQPLRHRDPGRGRGLPGRERPPRRAGERPALRAES